jgi:hypothetical protein
MCRAPQTRERISCARLFIRQNTGVLLESPVLEARTIRFSRAISGTWRDLYFLSEQAHNRAFLCKLPVIAATRETKR